LTNGYLRELGSGAGPELWDNMSRRAIIIITFIENCKRNAQMWNEIKAEDFVKSKKQELFLHLGQEESRIFDSTILNICF
jgi:hypothetical protein